MTANAAGGVKKLDASYNIVAAALQEIEKQSQKHGRHLKISPGIWPEASGGQTGANIESPASRAVATRPFSPT